MKHDLFSLYLKNTEEMRSMFLAPPNKATWVDIHVNAPPWNSVTQKRRNKDPLVPES